MAFKPERPCRSLFRFFLLVLVLHALILPMTWEFPEKVPPKAYKTLKVRLKNSLSERRQIVQSADSKNSEVKDEFFFSDKNRSFERQTRAKENSALENLKLSDIGLNGANPFRQAVRKFLKQKNNRTGHESLQPISSTSDYVEDIPLGDLTYLNTKEYKYYGFFHRIRQKLEGFWGQSIQEKALELARKGRHLAKAERFITALVIILDTKGEIVAIRIKDSSGVKELDQAAVESFNEAGPFPNPPRELIVEGHVTIEWGFVVNS